MNNLIGILLSFFLCQYLGRYSEAMIMFALISLAGLKFKNLQPIGIIGFVSTLFYVFFSSQSETNIFILLALPISLIIIRIIIKDDSYEGNHFLFILCILSALFINLLPDRDWIIFLLSLASTSLPLKTKNKKLVHKTSSLFWLIAVTLVLIIPALIILIRIPERVSKIAVVSGSSWAKFDKQLDNCTLDKLDISYMYSYSELVKLLNADIVTLEQAPEILNVQEIWMITPTMLLEENQIENLLNWIHLGGKLILVTDHTDLFGHATVSNKLLNKVGLNTCKDAFFPIDIYETAQTSLSYNLSLKTANTQSGIGLWPLMTARWVSEEADYSNRNFFGPMRATGTAKYGRRVIAGVYSFGKGQITIFGDSTIFANFAIYQPGYINFIEYLHTSKVMPILYGYLFILLFVSQIAAFAFKNNKILYILPLMGFWCFADLRKDPIDWPDYIICSGSEENVSELTDPKHSFSTAYSLIALTGKCPKWIQNPNSNEYGLWFSELPPPNKRWKWIKHLSIQDSTKIESPLQPLLIKLNTSITSTNYSVVFNDIVYAGELWTNDCMGEWWLDHGISKAKKKRFSKWLQIITGEKNNNNYITEKVILGNQYISYKLKYGDNDWETILLPEIKYSGKDEIYLGNGVSAKVVNFEGTEVLIGTKSLTEGWQAPSSWILVP